MSPCTDRGLPGRLRRPRGPRAFDVATLPYPGFPTDLQPFALTCNAVADGSAMVTENLFEARFRTVQELDRLGAETRIDGHHVMVHGVELLSGAPVEASDIRAGAALVIAGLVAEGVTTVSGAQHIDRGYAGFAEALRGARRRRHAASPTSDWSECPHSEPLRLPWRTLSTVPGSWTVLYQILISVGATSSPRLRHV